jgi:hypothetical protein
LQSLFQNSNFKWIQNMLNGALQWCFLRIRNPNFDETRKKQAFRSAFHVQQSPNSGTRSLTWMELLEPQLQSCRSSHWKNAASRSACMPPSARLSGPAHAQTLNPKPACLRANPALQNLINQFCCKAKLTKLKSNCRHSLQTIFRRKHYSVCVLYI